MMTSWIGCGVSINCDEPLGCYQGTIIEADGSTITLTRAFRNGFPYPKPQVTLKASDIKEIEIIDPNSDTKKKPHSTVEVTKKKPQKVAPVESLPSTSDGNPGSQSLPNSSFISQSGKFQNFTGNQYTAQFSQNQNHNQNQNQNQKQNSGYTNGFQIAPQPSNNNANNNAKSKPIDIQGRSNKNSNGGGGMSMGQQGMSGVSCMSGMSGVPGMSGMGGTPNKKQDKQKKRNEACFGTPGDNQTMTQDFDFEKNLALFDKQALWEELNQAQKPDVVRQTDHLRRNNLSTQKYRHDENILTSQPAAYRAIVIPEESRGALEYVTDDGLVIPTVTRELRGRVSAACARVGLGGGELLGRAGAEVALQLLGGGRRLHPCNTHQVPTVAFLIGPHRQGAVGVTCARHLACHGVSTVVLVAGADIQGVLRQHLNVYQMTGNKITTNILDLPSVDLIITALSEDTEDPTAYPHLTEWTSQSRAPVLALDPPAVGTPGIITKYSILPGLPLSHSLDNGKLYLCNVAIPQKIFTDLGIKYSSPFGSKFVIPLHPNDS